jgi:hypothetical protein
MAGGWLIKRGGQDIGPMSSDVLKQLAATGQLRPTDRVRKTTMDHFVQASAVKGLFPSDSGHGAPVVAEKARSAPHDEKKPESELSRTPVTAKRFPVFWARLGFNPRVALGGVGALVLLILFTLALWHHGDQDPGTDVVAGGPAESAPPAIAGTQSQSGDAAPQPAGDGAPNSLDQLNKVLVDLKVATQDVREAPQRQDELSDELRALSPDKAVKLAVEYLDPPETEARKRTAFLLVRNAANAGDEIAMLSLSYFYSSGIGTPASRVDAKEWLRKSAEAGYPDGMYEYSVAIRQGEYDGLGESNGLAWLRRSAAKGHKPAVDELKRIQVEGVVSALGAIGSILGSRNNDDSNDEGPACRQFGCQCRGFERAQATYKGQREIDPYVCWRCEHKRSDHRR